MKNNSGFTLIELMIGIAIVAVLAGVAVPNFSAMIIDSRQTTFYNKVSTTLRYARSEAIKRSTPVTVCPRKNKSKCGTDWSKGMLVFVDAAKAGSQILKHDNDDVTLRYIELPSTGISMTTSALLDTATSTATTTTIRFNGRGQPNWRSGTILMCDSRGNEYAKAIIMTGSGLGRKAYTTSSSSDVVVDASGTAVSCS